MPGLNPEIKLQEVLRLLSFVKTHWLKERELWGIFQDAVRTVYSLLELLM